MIFGDAIQRLQRTKWKDADELAKELATIFGSSLPVQIKGSIDITRQNDESPITISDLLEPSSTLPILSLRSNDSSVDLPMDEFLTGDALAAAVRKFQTPGQIPAVVVSGTGNNYKVDLYQQGYPGPTTRVSASQLQIDPTETIPPGTFVMVSQSGAQFFFQAPVWL